MSESEPKKAGATGGDLYEIGLGATIGSRQNFPPRMP